MHLAPNVFASAVGDKTVVLDLANDKYIGVGGALHRELWQIIDDGSPGSPTLRKQLLQRGIVAVDGEPQPRQHLSLPMTALWPRSGSAVGRRANEWGARISVLLALAEVSIVLRTLSIGKVIGWIRAEKRRVTDRVPVASLEELLAAYFDIRPWFPLKPICRLDAMALYLFLCRNGRPVDLVFGARLEPFAAHCWVQLDDLILNEDHDAVQQYTPIMAV